MEDRLEPLLAARPWALSPAEVVTDLDVLVPWMVQAEAALLARVRELDGQGIARRSGASSAAVWLRNRYLMAHSTALRYVKLAAAADAAPGPVQDAVADAEVNLDQAEAMMRSLAQLPGEIGLEVRDLAAKELVRLAAELDPAQLAMAGDHVLRVVAPAVADDMERKALDRAEARAREARAFTMTPDPTGFGYRISGRLTNESAAVLRTAIDPLCNPTRTADPAVSANSAAPVAHTTEAHATVAHVAFAHAAFAHDEPEDTRTATQRRADALVAVCRLALNTTELPRTGGDRPQVVVNIPYDVLEQELGAGTLDNGDRVTPESARRLACDCRLLPVVLDGVGQPLDVGRTRRLVSGALRQALIVRDHGCTFPGCDRGPRWTDGHHVVPWTAGGPTSLNNLALLCGFHHGLIHEPGGWTMYMATDGFPTFIPPRHLDPQQIPQRNRYHRRE